MAANDKWGVAEINDFVTKKTTQTTPLPNPAAAVIADIKTEPVVNTTATPAVATTTTAATTVVATEPVKTDADEPKPDARGQRADKELEALLKEGKNKLTLEELEKSAKNSYDMIFDGYKDGEENGFETTYYRVVETEKKVFTISKI